MAESTLTRRVGPSTIDERFSIPNCLSSLRTRAGDAVPVSDKPVLEIIPLQGSGKEELEMVGEGGGVAFCVSLMSTLLGAES